MSPPLLAHPRLEEPFILQTDASQIAIGAVLLQTQSEGTVRPLGYYSHKLNPAERNYSTYKRECLALVRGVKHFRVYLLAREFVIRTDHNALKWLNEREPDESILGRWITELQAYRFRIEHVRGSQNQAADALSRVSDSVVGAITGAEVQNDPDFPVDLQVFTRPIVRDWVSSQRSDPKLARVIEHLEKGTRPEDEVDLARYLAEWDKLSIKDSVLLLKRVSDPSASHEDGELVVVVPESEGLPLAAELHSLVHASADRTLGLAETRYWWPKMRRDFERAGLECDACDTDRRPNPTPCAPQESLPVMAPFEMVYIDIVGGQSALSGSGSNKYILSIIDSFTGWAEASPMPDQTADTVFKTFFREWVSRYGWPNRIHTDQGTQFESGLFKRMCDVLHVHKTRTTPYRPQANGKVERFNRTMASLLRRLVLEAGEPQDWEEYLPRAMMAYRTLVSETTGFTPYKLVFGKEMRLGVDPVFGLSEPPNDPKDQVLKLVQDLEDLYERARDQMSLRAERAANRLSEKAVRKFYRVGDMVRVQVNSLALKPPTKLAPRWSLPFEVKGVRGKTVLVENPRNGVRHYVSHDFLKHCYSAQAVTKGSQSQSCGDGPSAQQHAGARVRERG